MLTSLIDKCTSQLRTASRNVEDWAVACAGSWVTCLDNVSDLQPWLQDAICRAVTGDGLLRRQLYTDSDVSVLAFKRVIALTSIDPGNLNGDLADRPLTIELERISEDGRISEEDFDTQWRQAHPGALGGLLNVTVDVLRVVPAVRRSGQPRMADFARVLLAVDKVLATAGYDTFAEQAERTAEQVADSESVIVAIREHIREHIGESDESWAGAASELLKLLTPEKPPKDWPASPQAMGGRLSRAAPVMRRLGWVVEKRERSDEKGSRGWLITPPTEQYPAGSSESSGTSDSGSSDDSDNAARTSSHRAAVATVHVIAAPAATTVISVTARRFSDVARLRRTFRAGPPRPQRAPPDTADPDRQNPAP